MRFIIAICTTMLPSVVHAQTQCANVAEALTNLAATYGETVRVSALMTGGDVMIITAAPEK